MLEDSDNERSLDWMMLSLYAQIEPFFRLLLKKAVWLQLMILMIFPNPPKVKITLG